MAFAWVAAAAAIIGAGTSVYAQDRQRKANKKAERAEQVKRVRENTRALAQNRVTAAQIYAQAANTGTQGSSGVQGTLGSLTSQAAANQGFANQVDALRAQGQRYLDQAGIAQGIGQVAEAVGTYSNAQMVNAGRAKAAAASQYPAPTVVP